MSKNLLLPHRCKQIGSLLLLIALFLFFLAILLSSIGQTPGILLSAAITATLIAIPLTALSRERIEDEYISSLRGQTLIAVVYLFFILNLLWGAFLVFETRLFNFHTGALLNNYFVWLDSPIVICAVYVTVFNLRLWRLRRSVPETDQVA